MLTGTPGDTWMDYISVFLANGFYRSKSEFVDIHVEYNPFSNFPQVRRYHGVSRLERYRKQIIIPMRDTRTTEIDRLYIDCDFDRDLYKDVIKNRFNPFTNEPIQNASEFTQVIRRIVNTSERRISNAKQIFITRKRIIVFYNYTYELDILKDICVELGRKYYQWNGKKHEPIPDDNEWIYLVQYIAGAEGWNCITTDTILFYSLNYSYRIMEQSEGRINRINTPFKTLHYKYLKSSQSIDDSILKAIRNKGRLNERNWAKQYDIGT